jgi:hypothetical protein
MAKVKIQGNASGAGIFTITPPATSTDRTVTLPDATGTLLMTDGSGASLTGISAGADTSLSNLTATGENRVCHAWVNFDGVADTVRDSYNVSSVANLTTADNKINYSTNMSNTNYCVASTARQSGNYCLSTPRDWNTTDITIGNSNPSSSLAMTYVNVMIFGD